jgi:AcrR family transcriptional regulator
MVQVKKNEVREAILKGAKALFREKGYNATTLRDISKRSKISLASIYVYFESKLDIIFALHAPWFVTRMDQIEAKTFALDTPEERFRFILKALWQDLPADSGMAANLLQALSASTPDERFNPDLSEWAERKLGRILANTLPEEVCGSLEEAQTLAHVLLMALDGFAINHRLLAGKCPDAALDAMCRLAGLHKSKKPLRTHIYREPAVREEQDAQAI